MLLDFFFGRAKHTFGGGISGSQAPVPVVVCLVCCAGDLSPSGRVLFIRFTVKTSNPFTAVIHVQVLVHGTGITYVIRDVTV